MSARDDYPMLARIANTPGPQRTTETRAALDEIDRLRAQLAQAHAHKETP